MTGKYLCLYSKYLCLYSKVEKSVLLYAESCLVDNYGRMNHVRMNQDDFDALDVLKAEGLLDYGRLPFKEIEKSFEILGRNGTSTHWVSFSDKTWEIVWAMRKERAVDGRVKLLEILERHK